MFEARDAAFFLLMALSLWKIVEVIQMLRKVKPVRPRQRGKAAEVAVRHLKTLEWCHTRGGTQIHMRGCHVLKETDEVIEKATSRRKGSEGKPHEVKSRMLCTSCAVRLDNSLRIELESTD